MSIFEFDPTLYGRATENEKRFRLDRLRALQARLYLYRKGFKAEAKLADDMDLFRAEFEHKMEECKAVWASSLDHQIISGGRSLLGAFIGTSQNCAIIVGDAN